MNKIDNNVTSKKVKRNKKIIDACIAINTKIDHPVSLLPHNQDMYNRITEAINNGEHSIFYSEATGLGKSFIFMRLVYDLFRNKKVLYIVPKIAIWNNMNTYKEFELIKDCVEMTTYADFNLTKKRHYEYDAIFIDECHHLLSDIQGANIIEVCNDIIDDGKYVFGFTATPRINKYKNVDAFFNTKVYGMDLIQATEAGLFKKIEYAVADPDTKVEDEKCAKRFSIDSTKTLLENILDERKDITRWLVYFRNITALKKNLPSIKKLFPDYEIFILHSQKDDNEEQLLAFNQHKGKSMLLTVSMVLEGVHPKNVGGILLYRNVTKYNTLLQVLGRICSMSVKSSPLCVDITTCIDNITASYLNGCMDDNDEYDERKISKSNDSSDLHSRGIKSIIDINASSYRYIELLTILNRVIQEYRGIIWKTDEELSLKLGKGKYYVSDMKKQGLNHQQIIDKYMQGDLKKYSHNGYYWDTDTELSILLGKGRGYVNYHKHRGLSYPQIIEEAKNSGSKKYSYKGYEWDTNTELSVLLGKYKHYVKTKINMGLTYNQIIDDCCKPKKYSYKGYEWDSDAELEQLLGKNRGYIEYRKNKGLTYNQIIDDCIEYKPKKYSYKGYEWDSDAELTLLLGRGDGYVSRRKRNGKTCKQIIDEALDKKKEV